MLAKGSLPPVHARLSARATIRANAAASQAPVAAQPDAEELKARVVADEAKYVLQTYGRPSDLVIVRGEGSKVYDASGKEYLDFAAGIAVNALGHGDARWVKAVKQQAGELMHTSNLFHTVQQVDLAKRLVESSFADKVFFCNSGTEANEGAIKFARKYARITAGADAQDENAEVPTELVAFTGSFHGRTMGALALTAKTQYQKPFLPIMPGVSQAEFGSLESAAEHIKKGRTAAVFVEPIQGEGGVNPSTQAFLEGLRQLCDEAGALLVFDEVQCGVGRTGKLWAHEHFGVEPDILTTAKPLAGGLPIGAVLMKQRVADVMSPGDHGSTFAGNPLVCAAANATFDVIAEPAFLADVERKGERLRSALRDACGDNAHVVEVRGSGLLVGVQLDVAGGGVVEAARGKGVIVITAGTGDVIRIVPPLTCTDAEIDHCAAVVAECIADL
eukprot:jgi/Ulvmu1/12114/UM084_0040.1